MKPFSEQSNSELLSTYKTKVRNAPFTFTASNDEMNAYYDSIFALEAEIKKRMGGNS